MSLTHFRMLILVVQSDFMTSNWNWPKTVLEGFFLKNLKILDLKLF